MADNDQKLDSTPEPAGLDEFINTAKNTAQDFATAVKNRVIEGPASVKQAIHQGLDALDRGDYNNVYNAENNPGVDLAMGTIGEPKAKIKFINESNLDDGLLQIKHPLNKDTLASGQSLGGHYDWWLDPENPSKAGELPYNNVATLEALSVHPELQNKGIGGQLIKEYERLAKKTGHDAVMLNASPMGVANSSRDPSRINDLIEFYKSHGYEPYGPKDSQSQMMIKPLVKPKKMADGGEVAPEGLDAFLSESDGQPQDNQLLLQNPNAIPQSGAADSAPTGLDEFIAPEVKEEKYGGTKQTVMAGLEGGAEGLAGAFAPKIEQALGVSTAEDIRGRQEAHPIVHGVAQLGTLIGGSMAGIGVGGALAKVGEGAALASKALNLGKIGSAVARGALESAALSASDEATKMVLKDPKQSSTTALLDIGIGTLLGGGLGGTLGAAGKLWEAGGASKTGQLLKTIANRVGGVEGIVPDSVNDVISKSGLEIAPELRTGLSNEPGMQSLFSQMNQNDVNASGKQFQKTYNNFRKQAGDTIVTALGKTPDEINAIGDLSKYEAGKAIGNTLADEYETKLAPFAQSFEDLKSKLKNVPLTQDALREIGSGEVVPGAMSQAVDKISKLAQEQGWTASPSSEIMQEVNRVIKELPLQKNLKNLGDYITQIGNNTSDFTNGPLRRAGGMIKSVLRDTEADTISNYLSKTEGPAALEAFKASREGYSVISDLKDQLQDRLHIKGANTSNFAKSLRYMAQTDGESVLSRLSGVGDADLISTIQKSYPETANMIRDYHLNNILKQGADKAAPGMTINSEAVLKMLNKMSPELRNSIVAPEALERVNAIGAVLDRFNSLPHNFSNTGRLLDSVMQHIPGSVTGLITGIVTHNPIIGSIVGALTKSIGRDIPDAVKLGLMKFLGTSAPVDAVAFREAVQHAQHVIKGEQLLTNSVKNVFKEESNVIPIRSLPTDKDRAALDKTLKKIQADPKLLMDTKNKAAYYMPDHGAALAQTAASVSNFLNSSRPMSTQQSPLDSPIPPSDIQKSEYNRKLDLAQQPLIIMNKIKDGSLTSNDVIAIKTMYPALYDRISQKLYNNMIEAKAKGREIPYSTKMSLSLFFGQPLDSTMSPQSIQAAQVANQSQIGQDQPQGESKGSSSKSNNSLQKLSNLYKTPGQKAEERKINKE